MEGMEVEDGLGVTVTLAVTDGLLVGVDIADALAVNSGVAVGIGTVVMLTTTSGEEVIVGRPSSVGGLAVSGIALHAASSSKSTPNANRLKLPHQVGLS